MINIIDKKMCSGCGACQNICPKNSISLVKDNEGFLYPKINKDTCINCSLCEKVCPFLNEKNELNKINLAYAIKNKNEEIRKESSSGGAFYELAKYVILNKGVVYGASFNETFNDLNHIKITELKDIIKLTKSKYFQSKTNDTFKECKLDLLNGKKVLYVGTPCQINGLLNYLGKPYENLITSELICHGVPSKKMYDDYLTYLEKKYKGKVLSLNFRKKLIGEDKFGIKKENNLIKIYEPMNKNLYMKYFLSDVSLRHSCYDCKVKNTCKADITIGDFWSINFVAPEFADELGTSIMIIHNKKLIEIIKSLNFDILEVPFEKSLEFNPSYFFSSIKPKARDKFYLTNPFSKSRLFKIKIKSFLINSKNNIKMFIKRILILLKVLPKNNNRSAKDLIYGVEVIIKK